MLRFGTQAAETLMTFGVTSLSDARDVLRRRIAERMDPATMAAADLARLPVVLIWVPEHLPKARETVAAYGSWNTESSHFLDIVFFGWLFDNGSFYDPEAYQRCVDEVRQASKWRPTGDVDLLLLNFEYETATRSADFNFTEAIPLPIGQMIIEGRVPNIQVFVQELINHARDIHAHDRANPVWEIHQRLALDRGRRSLWEWVSRTFLKDVGTIYDDMRPYAVCNLAKAMNPG
jgi:hypothetical protein